MKKIIAGIIVVVIAGASALFLKQQKEKVENLSTPKEYAIDVETTLPQYKEVQKRKSFLAQLNSSDSAFISSKFSARIKKIHVQEGAYVKKGDLLVSLDDSELQANLAALHQKKSALLADVQNTKKSLQRNKKLLEINAISKEMYDNSVVMYKNKKALYDNIVQNIIQAKSQLQYLNIRAPFNAKVGSKLLDDGSLSLPGKPILTLNSQGQKMIFTFAPDDVENVAGKEAFVDGQRVGRVSKIYDDARNGLSVAEITVQRILPYPNKSYLHVDVLSTKKTGCSVEKNTLLHKDGKTYVMEYKEGRFIAMEVGVILENDTEALIEPCTQNPIAVASEAKLSLLPSYENVLIKE